MLEKKPLPSVFRVTALVISQILYFLQSVLHKRIRIRGLRPTASPRTLCPNPVVFRPESPHGLRASIVRSFRRQILSLCY